jgi:hypothetical protein
MVTRLCALLGALALACVAGAQAVPTDNELRSAYCLGVLRAEIGTLQNALAQAESSGKSAPPPPAEVQEYAAKFQADSRERLAGLQTAYNRLMAYMMPKLSALDSSALMGATSRAHADWQEFMEQPNRCIAKCDPSKMPKEDARACFSKCADNDLITRVKACETPTWLPY